jgi:HD-GYP domain-containing protein (c-di-GMP phosphodiesterase class II)
VQKTLENLGNSAEIVNLRIVSNDGYILKSKKPDEIGLKSKEYAAIKYSAERYRPAIQKNMISHLTPIPNKKPCYGCHSEDIKVNGIIEIKYDITRNAADILAIKRFLILSNIVTVIIVAGILSLLFTSLITTPLRGFMNTIQQVEDGDWDARINTSSTDEFGIIGQAFNKMLQEIKNLYEKSIKKEKEISRVKVELDHKRTLEELNAQLQHKIKEVETSNKAVLSLSKEVKFKNIELEGAVERLKKINEVGRVMTSIIETDELMKLFMRTTAEMLEVEKGFIHLIKDERTKLALQYQRGIGIESAAHVTLEEHPLFRDIVYEGNPVLMDKGSPLRETNAVSVSSAIGVPLKMKGQIIGGMLLEEKKGGRHFTMDELQLLWTMANQAMVAIENAWLYDTVKSNYFGTMQSLVNALEASDNYTKGHSERVKFMSIELAKFVGLDHREIEMLEHAAILHDIGKIGIDSAVLNKIGRLSNAEFSLIKAHPIIGDEIIGPIGTLEGVRTTILQHHERYDGRGYPYGIAGDEISLKARILAVVDTFDAMLADRPYRDALPFHRALDELRNNAGTQFDPFVVNAFFEMLQARENVLLEAGYSVN